MPSQVTEPRLTKVPATTPASDVLEILLREGGLIIERIAEHTALDAVWDELQPHLHAKRHTGVAFSANARQVAGLAGKSPTFATKLLTTPLYQEVVDLLMAKVTTVTHGDGQTKKITSRPQLTNSMAFYLGPGSKAQGLHRDDQCHHTRHPAKYETELGIMFAGTKSHRANGATNVVPGSNHWDDHRKPSPDEAVPAELEKGDALLWLGSTYHGAGFNSTENEFRLLLAAFMTPGWCRQDENQYLAYSKSVVDGYPADVAQLLGY